MNNGHIILSHLGLLKVSGSDAARLLQGQVTCQVEAVSPEHAHFAALCNPQGKVISFFRLFFFQNAYYLQMSREMVAITKRALEKYAVFYKVILEDASDAFFQYGLYTSETALEKPNQQLTEDNYILLREWGEPARWILISQSKEIASEKNLNAWRCTDIANHIPTIYPDTSEKFFSHELNLTALDAISFKKGCYTGQEIIARMYYKGKPKTYLTHITLEKNSSLKRGQDFTDNLNHTATLVDYNETQKNQCAALVIMPLRNP
ncbi:MAG: hypothetical protein SFW66_03500 [Gammaproteobacteria bacterium]|nr:hypothetical protein [Gammaproteobacteria bacterium]